MSEQQESFIKQHGMKLGIAVVIIVVSIVGASYSGVFSQKSQTPEIKKGGEGSSVVQPPPLPTSVVPVPAPISVPTSVVPVPVPISVPTSVVPAPAPRFAPVPAPAPRFAPVPAPAPYNPYNIFMSTPRTPSNFPPNGLVGRYVVFGRVSSLTSNINIREIEIYNSSGVKYNPTSAFLSSVLNDNTTEYGPQSLIDGNKNTYAATNATSNQYMLLDLGMNQNIGKITIYVYVTDLIRNNIRGCQVQVFDNNLQFVWASNIINTLDTVYTYPTPVVSNPYNILMSTSRTPSVFPINGLSGRYIVVGRVQYYQTSLNTLQLREIEVYNSSGAKYVSNNLSTANISTSTIGIPMTAFSTSVFDDDVANYGPQILINGVIEFWNSASTKANPGESNPRENQYMLVDLGANRDIGKLMIYNYSVNPSIANRIIGCQVQVFDNNFNFLWASNIINTGASVYTYMYTPPPAPAPVFATGSTGSSTGVI
jgi:hypothetical protein